MILSSFSELSEILNLKSRYEILIEDNKIQVPRKHFSLNVDTAQWAMKKINVFNKKTKATREIVKVCKDFLLLTESINNITFSIE